MGASMAGSRLLVTATIGAFLAAPAFAQSSPETGEARLRAAIAEAKLARDAAAEALRKTDDAIAILERSVPRDAPVMAEAKSAI